jgi:hypothetical protein
MIRTILLIGWFVIVLIRKIPPYVSLSLGILILVLSACGIVLDHQGIALRLTTYAFGIICVGWFSYMRDLIQNEKK